jgi:glycosyltransferase involved in cell wall biosynthesis
MRILIATDAWEPQINGVVKTLRATIGELEKRGHALRVVAPHLFRRAAMPGYPEIEVAWPDLSMIRSIIREWDPDHIHVATEGPIGWAVRRLARSEGRIFTTSFHTRFPEYLRARLPVPLGLTYRALRRFHNAGRGVMVATPSIRAELERRGFTNVMPWGRGVDLAGFRPTADRCAFVGLPRPIFLTVGRLAPEKNMEAFLSLSLPGTKVVIGDGPAAPTLRAMFPEAVFLGAKSHGELPTFYAGADVFVFPSRTDTFGLVLIEALACGLPVAAFPAPGPVDIVADSGAGIIGEDLAVAALAALAIDRETCRRHAEGFTWAHATDQFVANLEAAHASAVPAECARSDATQLLATLSFPARSARRKA